MGGPLTALHLVFLAKGALWTCVLSLMAFVGAAIELGLSLLVFGRPQQLIDQIARIARPQWFFVAVTEHFYEFVHNLRLVAQAGVDAYAPEDLRELLLCSHSNFHLRLDPAKKGGIGQLAGVYAGVLLLSAIQTAINLMGLPAHYTQLILGFLGVAALVGAVVGWIAWNRRGQRAQHDAPADATVV